MKVTFACEKCGKVLDSYLYDCSECYPPMKRLVDETCPVCAKLTYGPLTEEMVAEALCAARGGRQDLGDSEQARFVLRLLGALAPHNDEYLDRPEINWRDYLLRLARKP